MRKAPNPLVEKWRVRTGRMRSDERYGNNGLFVVPGPDLQKLTIIASDQDDWEHVSVSLNKKTRLPTWQEMCHVKDLFWDENECVIQYHPQASEYVNFTEALHMWKPIGVALPQPPHGLVGPKDIEESLRQLKTIFTGTKP